MRQNHYGQYTELAKDVQLYYNKFPLHSNRFEGEIVFKIKLYRKNIYKGLNQNRQRNHQKTLPVFQIKWIQKLMLPKDK